MIARLVVTDTSPLRALAHLGLVDALTGLFAEVIARLRSRLRSRSRASNSRRLT